MNLMRAGRIQAGVLVVCLLALDTPAVAVAGQAASPTISYTYDGDGRLLTVTNAAGQTSTYSYDAAGNITGISQPAADFRKPASQARRTGPAPELGPLHTSARAGSVLTLPGRHFSPDRSLDKVNIGRLIAPVLAASASRLTVRVPPGSGGTVAVLTPAGVARNGRVTITGSPAGPATPVTRAPGTGAAPKAPPGVTALSGRVETAAGHPLAGVRVSITGLWGPDTVSATTGRSGWFLLTHLAAGKHQLLIGATSVGGTDYGTYAEPLQVPGGRTTVLPWITYLTPIDTAHAVTVPSPTTKPVVVTSPELPGVQVRIPKGTVIRDRAGRIVRKLSLTALPLKRTPFPLAPGMPDFFTLQPEDATFSGPGVRVTYPNVTHLPAGATVSYVALNPSWGTASWYQYGTGTVTAGGTQIVPATHTVFHQVIPFGYSPLPAPNPAPPPAGPTGGEPVDLFTGLYTMNATDLSLPDGLPSVLTRTYRDQDDVIRGFGLGMEDGFDWFVTPDPVINGDYALILPNGSRIDYAPSSTPGVWDAVSNPAGFAGSVLTRGVDGTSTFIVTLKNGTVYVFGALEAFLIKETNQYGASLTISREEDSGDIQTVTTPGGKWMRFSYGVCLPGSSPVNCVTQVTDDAGRTVSYSYDSNARLTGVTDANGGHTSYTWASCTDSLTCTELLTITDPNKITALTNTYDSTGVIISQTDADGGHWHYSYGVNGPNDLTTVTDPRGNRTKWVFGPNRYPVSETVADGTTQAEKTTFSYGAATNLLNSSTDPLGRKTSYTYDSLGNLTSVTQLAGTAQAATTKFSYEPVHNRIASVTNPNGDTVKLTYNDQARTITETDPLGHATVITVSPSAQPVEYTDSLGNRTYLSYYDGDLITVADPAGDYTSAFYDGAGNPLQVTDPEGNAAQATYNPLGEITSITDPLGHATDFGYDPDGDLTSMTDAEGHTTKYTYTPMLQVASITDPLGHTTSYSYDTAGNPAQTTNRNGVTDTFRYDALNRLTTAVYGTNTKAPITVTPAYDQGNRLTSITETGSGTDTFSTDGLGDILTAGSPQGTVSYTYNSAGQRLSMTAPGQSTVDYTYNRDGLITGITQGTSKVSIGYDTGLRIARVGLPNGITRTNTYDAASRLTGISYASGRSTIGSLGYTYTPDSRVATVSGSLAAVTMPTAVTSATFNADNELTRENGTIYSYDKQGNLTSDGTSSYSWNAIGQLSAITGPTNSSYTYDPFGRLATTTTAGTTTSNLYDGTALIQQSTGAGTTSYLTSDPDTTYQETATGSSYTPLTDGLGSVIALTSPAGAITTSYTYTPGGAQTTSGNPSFNTFGYVGAPLNSAGLVQLGVRFYNPAAGRFISQDPLGYASGTTDLYQYALADPVNLTDRSGLSAGSGGGCSSGRTNGCPNNNNPNNPNNNNDNSIVNAKDIGALIGALLGAPFGAYVSIVTGFLGGMLGAYIGNNLPPDLPVPPFDPSHPYPPPPPLPTP